MRSHYVARRPVANAYLVRERDRRRLRELGLVLLVTLPLGLAALANVWVHRAAFSTGYRIDRLERQLQELRDRERYLEVEAARLARPETVELRAAQELGMQQAEVDQLVFAGELE